MKGLMLNNLHLLRRNAVFYLGFWLAALLLNVLSHVEAVDLRTLTPILFFFIIGTLPLVSIEGVSHAINAKWDVLQKAMPTRKGTIIASYYITYILLSAAALGVWLLLPFEYGNTSNIIHSVLLVQLICIFYYPMHYLLYLISPKNESTGQLLIIFAALLALAGSSVFVRFTEQHNEIAAAVVVSALLYALSFGLSVHFDRLSRKGFRRKQPIN